MKSNDLPPLYFSKPPERKNNSGQQESQSPYLKAILSGDIKRSSKVVRMTLSDRLAAIRYIQDSKWRHNLFRG